METLKTKVEQSKTTAENLSDHLGDYVETYVKLTVVKATEKATAVATVSLSTFLLFFFGMFVFLFGGVAFAIWIGEATGNMKAGYFYVAGFYFICLAVLLAMRKSIIFPFIRNHIIRKVYE